MPLNIRMDDSIVVFDPCLDMAFPPPCADTTIPSVNPSENNPHGPWVL